MVLRGIGRRTTRSLFRLPDVRKQKEQEPQCLQEPIFELVKVLEEYRVTRLLLVEEINNVTATIFIKF